MSASIPELFTGLCDDAAIFPPGSVPLAEAVPAHRRHTDSGYADLVGPLVLSAAALTQVGPLLEDLPDGSLPVSVTVAGPDALPEVFASLAQLPALQLVALEVALPPQLDAADVVPALDAALAAAPVAHAPDVTVFVEVPRDARRAELIAALARSEYRAKFRTGGVTAELHPDPAELADAVQACVAAQLPFKATAGLHHAVRHTDPATGFEQHGFLNILLAVDAALQCAEGAQIEALLAERDSAAVASRIADLDESRAQAARALFVSFGTCSVTDPLTDLTALGLVDAAVSADDTASVDA